MSDFKETYAGIIILGVISSLIASYLWEHRHDGEDVKATVTTSTPTPKEAQTVDRSKQTFGTPKNNMKPQSAPVNSKATSAEPFAGTEHNAEPRVASPRGNSSNFITPHIQASTSDVTPGRALPLLDGSLEDCEKETLLHSSDAKLASHIRFVNETESAREVFWLTYTGQREYRFTLPPKTYLDQETYVSHYWVVTDVNHHCVAVFESDRVQSTINIMR